MIYHSDTIRIFEFAKQEMTVERKGDIILIPYGGQLSGRTVFKKIETEKEARNEARELWKEGNGDNFRLVQILKNSIVVFSYSDYIPIKTNQSPKSVNKRKKHG